MRAFVGFVALACAGCSLFLLDGLADVEPARTDDAGTDGATSDDAGDANAANAANDANDGAPPNEEGGPSGVDPYGDTVRADAPIGWWRLDDTASSSVAKDATGKTGDAVIQGKAAVAFGQAGAIRHGTAFGLDGSSYLDLGDRLGFPSPQAYTFEAWVKSSIAADDLDYHGIFTKIPFGQTQREGRWMFFSNDMTPRVALEEWNPSGIVTFVNANMTLPTTRFVHVVASYDGTNSRLYIDGQLLKTAPRNGAVGATPIVFKWGDGWKGALDELAAYDKALDSTRIKAHFDAAQDAK